MQKIKLSRQKKKSPTSDSQRIRRNNIVIFAQNEQKKIETFLLKFSGGKINALIFYVNIKKRDSERRRHQCQTVVMVVAEWWIDVSLLIKTFPSEKSQNDEPTLFQLQHNRLFLSLSLSIYRMIRHDPNQ